MPGRVAQDVFVRETFVQNISDFGVMICSATGEMKAVRLPSNSP
jgi:hypothetical protein